MRCKSAWSSFATIIILVNLGNIVLGQSDDDPYNLDKFNQLRLNDPQSLCRYLTCLPPVKQCPEGTSWVENVAMYGCCGGCVRFITDNTACTGSIDPAYGGGYCELNGGDLSCPEGQFARSLNAENTVNSTSFKASLRTTTLTDASGSNIIESSWCGYGYQCTKTIWGNVCQKPAGSAGSRTCTQVHDLLEEYMKYSKYDEHRDDYLWLPDCTVGGSYKPKQCKGPLDEQRCVCVNPSGGSIFGSAYSWQEELYETMNCECSRRVWEQQNQEGVVSPTLHCLDNGNYEPLQCENGYCYCIDPNTTLTYGPTVPEKAMFILPCYNTTLLGENNKYLRLCESEYHAHTTLAGFMRDKGISEVPLTSTSCDPDGSFSGLQCKSGDCSCVDKTNTVTDEEGRNVNGKYGCDCMRDKSLLASYGQTLELDCRGGSGGYYTYHVDDNGAYCQDEQGIRRGPKVRPEYCCWLQCNSATNCQANGQADDDPVHYCEMTCSIGNSGVNPIPCPPCVYTSYQGDMSECDDLQCSVEQNSECTDEYHGNE